MKQTLLILALITSTIQTFAQSPRIKLNQITKDTVKGSVLISSPSDSGMVYSRDFYIAYGADTVLILYGDTLAATSDIISSVLSDGVTITGNGTSGNELKVDTSLIATIKALNDSLATISASTTPDNVTITGDGSVGNPLKVDTATVISTIQGLVDTLSARGYLTANQTITLSGDVTGSGTTSITATVVDDSHNHIISNVDFLQDSLTAKANASELSNYLLTSNYIVDSTRINATGDTAFYYQNGVEIGSQSIAGGGGTSYNNISETADTVFIDKYLNVDTSTLYVDATNNNVGIGTTSPLSKLTVSDNFLIGANYADLTVNSQSGLPAAFISNDSVFGNFYFGNSNASATFFGFGHLNSSNTLTSRFIFNNFDNVNNTSDFSIQTRGTGFGTSYALKVTNAGELFISNLDDTTGVSANMYYNTTSKELMYITSSQRYKTNIRDYDRGIDDLMKLRPVYYQPKNSTTNNNVYNTGFIAEEVESIGLTEYIDYDENGLANSIHYSLMTAILTKATQEQQAIIETQEQKITDLETTIQTLITRIENLENK